MTRRSIQQDQRLPIPEFSSHEEEAEFWDAHSLADYWDAAEPVKVAFMKPLTEELTIRLDVDTVRTLHVVAAEKGIGPTTLARMWLLERLQNEAPPTSKP